MTIKYRDTRSTYSFSRRDSFRCEREKKEEGSSLLLLRPPKHTDDNAKQNNRDEIIDQAQSPRLYTTSEVVYSTAVTAASNESTGCI